MPRAVLNGTVLADSYPKPSPLARRIKGHIAFDNRVRVEPTDHDQPRPRRSLLSRLRREPTAVA